jgi:RNA polymerase sigma-B factor
MNRDELIESHLPLARSLAHRYRHTAEPLDDLVQVASLGLVKAAERWNPERGFAFSSFAVPTILGELRRHFRDKTWDVRPPRGLQETCLAVERAFNDLARGGVEPTAAHLAVHLERPAHEVAEALQALDGRRLASLDAPARSVEDETIAVADTVGCEEDGYARIESRDAFDRLVAGADKPTRSALRLRFEHDLVQAEIAARVGCSQMQVSRLIRRGLERLAPQLSPAT